MPTSEEQERIAYYQSRKQVGPYLSKLYSFFPGQPTLPNNETANKAIYINNGRGPGDKILNGITPFVPEALPCDEVVITSLVTGFLDPFLVVTVLYNALPDDILTLFNTSTGQVLLPVYFALVPGGVEVEFDMTSPPATGGAWSFKITRADNLDCFAVRSNVFTTSVGGACALAVTGLGPPSFPVIPPGPPGFPGGVGFFIELTGTGFLEGPLTIEVIRVFGGPPVTLVGYSITVIDDTSLNFLFDGDGSEGFFGVRVSLTADPTCFGEIGFEGPPGIALIAS